MEACLDQAESPVVWMFNLIKIVLIVLRMISSPVLFSGPDMWVLSLIQILIQTSLDSKLNW